MGFLCWPSIQKPLAALKQSIALVHPLPHAPNFAKVLIIFTFAPLVAPILTAMALETVLRVDYLRDVGENI